MTHNSYTVAHAYTPSTSEAEARGPWSRCQPELISKTLPQEEKGEKKGGDWR